MTKQVHGEGNYEATRDYNERTKEYLESADVTEDARKAAPNDEKEAQEMQRAEEAGKRRAKGAGHEANSEPAEDPAVVDKQGGAK